MKAVAQLLIKRSPEFIILALSSLIAFGMYLGRVYFAESRYYLFLSWNLFLAWIPYLIAMWLEIKLERPKWLTAAGLMGWLLFFPNAPYILTDLFHLRPRNGSPLWLDLIVLLAFAWTGLILGLSSLRKIQLNYFDRLGHIWGRVITLAIIFLTSFGVYLGRYLRWNSWDVVSNPLGLLEDIFVRVIFPHEYLRSTGFTICFGLFLVMAYLMYIVRNSSLMPEKNI